MNKLPIALLIGAGAGALELLPTLLRKAPWHELAVLLGAAVGWLTQRYA